MIKYEINGQDIIISLPCGNMSYISLEDEDILRAYKHAYIAGSKSKYVMVETKMEKRIRKRVYLHNLILAKQDNLVADHIDRDRMNNRRHNLRLCTQAQNLQNKSKNKKRLTSRYKGVCYKLKESSANPWVAHITRNKKTCRIGGFSTEICAAKAYDREAKELFGKFACLNFPDEA